jgi:ribA/ribD-fused uncharacterized protein
MIDKFDDEFRFLSNFWPCFVELDGMWFPSVEHAYQAAKTLDKEKRRSFTDTSVSPGLAKKWGSTLSLRNDWEAIKVDVMRRLLEQKFNRPDLREKLLATGPQELVEGNYWGDTFWGVCRGVGQNNLGKLLMAIRMNLKEVTKNE